jgi:hypothetical protein
VAIEQLGLQSREEALGDGVVEDVADGSHGPEEADVAESLTEHPGGVLGAVVGVVDRLTGMVVDDTLGPGMIGDRPADDLTVPGIDGHGQLNSSNV